MSHRQMPKSESKAIATNLTPEQKRALIAAFNSAYHLVDVVAEDRYVEVHMLIDHLEDICDPDDLPPAVENE